MKRSASKIMISFLLIFAMAFMLPSVAKAATITGSGGTGTESDPHKLTIGYCEDDTFSYTCDKYKYSYLSVTFTSPAEVSCSFAQNGPWGMVLRNGSYSFPGESFYVKQGETVDIMIKSGSNSIPIHFKSVALSDPSSYCAQSSSGKHDFPDTWGSTDKCRKCGYACTHPKNSREYCDEYTWLSDRKHVQRFKCQICHVETYDTADAKACTLSKWIPNNNHSYHCASCTLCGKSYQQNCSFTKKTYKHSNWRTHTVYDTCSVCGKLGAASGQNHIFKSDKCIRCNFKRIVPGASKVTYMKQTGKMKIKKYHRNGYFDRFWEWHPARTTTTYNYKIKIKFKKAKNAERYVVSTLNDIDTGVICNMGKNKTSATFTYTASKKVSKVKLYLIPISKTGTPGKSVKKIVKLKN